MCAKNAILVLTYIFLIISEVEQLFKYLKAEGSTLKYVFERFTEPQDILQR